MIPNDPKLIEKLKAQAERNVANGDWGEETTIPGIPGGTVPMSPEERVVKGTVSNILSKRGGLRLPRSSAHI